MLVRIRSRVRPPTLIPKLTRNTTSNTLNPKTPKKTAPISMNKQAKRPTCPNCSKPTRFCFCTRLGNHRDLDNKVSVTILQHSLETKHPLNSARIAKLGLKNVDLYTVTDVNFGARFIIWLFQHGQELGLVDNGLKCPNLDGVLEGSRGKSLGGPNCNFVGGSGLQGENEFRSEECGGREEGFRHEKPVITVGIGKYGVISDLDCVWMMPRACWQKRPSFDEILASEVAVGELGRGFVVKKLQKRQVVGRVELEEYKEFELMVPPGSVLLFPSDQAVNANELKEVNFKVRNLIVLDGTWAKARRMYEENPWLRLLPHLRLEFDRLSLYNEVRHQPKAGYLSTIESIVYGLRVIGECPEGLDNLLEVFESMVGDQRRCKDERLNNVSPV